MKHSSAEIVTLSAQRLAYGSIPLELAGTRPRSTDVTILMPGTDYFGETALKQDIRYPAVSTMRKSHNHTLLLHYYFTIKQFKIIQ